MKNHLEFILSTRANRQFNLLNGLIRQGFGVQIDALRTGKLTPKQFNNYLKKIPGVKGLRRLQVEWGANTRWLVVFVDDSNPYVTVIVGTHFLIKKKGPVPDKEIAKAVRTRQDYEAGK